MERENLFHSNTSQEGSVGVDICTWEEAGYKPLIFSHDWQVALLNWEPIFDLDNAREIERHKETDEVFVLWRGRGLLFIAASLGLKVEDMTPGVIYNVRKGTWHNLLATHDASFIIVENRDTHIHDTEIRVLTEVERQQLKANLPDWLNP
jgi:mannose-6-phosphate isomerase-like protein (cupin superfamily)